MSNWSRLDSITMRQLEAFCAVVRHLSYTKAAEELGCQQPTISALVGELERATQLTLLEQWGRQIALTSEGHELHMHAQRLMAAADETERAMDELREGISGEEAPLRVAADTTVGTYVLPHLLGAFHQRHPTITLKQYVANRADVRACLLAGDVDLVIAGRPPAVDGIETEPFLTNPLVVVAAPGHELVGQKQVPLARLTQEPFLLREAGSGTRAAVEEVFEIAGLPLKVSMVLGHVEAIKQAVAAGLGVSVLSAVAIKREVRHNILTILDVQQFPIHRRWYIARLALWPLTSSAAAFIDFLHEYELQNK
ncbi:MAG: LysR family transcriptional regulator [Chloroflexi bacterium]|nr:LysR family transcriptional regulator [Ktedonobacteraceae bacterium]MBV8822203.1 LysR family transcriptional regulator [Ktedonobacteraceae bacterium]MBV9020877.1 LysR family transcriptional regulator [Ktedonobacteraceae bacterium]MBV9707227.1 LysR family transcriptional regulator [Chloroflexota bacterium]